MEYYRDNKILIRTILPSDPQTIYDEEIAPGRNQTVDKYMARLKHHNAGESAPNSWM